MHKRGSHKNHQFIYFDEYDKSKNYSFKRAKTSKLKINCFDKDNNFIKTYDSINETINDGFNPKNVSAVINKTKKSHKGFYFLPFQST